MDEIARFLREHAPWRDLPPEGVAGVASRLEIEYYARGATILSAGGRPPTHLIVIRSGSVDRRGRGEASGAGIERLAEGDIVDPESFLGRRPPEADVVAREDTLAYLVPRDALAPLLAVPPVRRFLAGTAGDRVRGALETAVSASGGDLLVTAVGELVTRPALGCGPETPVDEAARKMRDAGVGSLVVLSDPPGIVTDRDLRDRVLATGGDPRGPVGAVASSPLVTVPADALLLEALARQVDSGVHHLPVTRDGRIVGVVTDTDLLRRQSRSPLLLRRVLERARTPADTASWVGLVGAAMEALVADGIRASAIGRLASLASDALLRHLLDDGARRLGPAPAPWTWLATGAEGRCEAAWPPSRAGFVLFEDGAPREMVAWCAALGGEVSGRLEAAGLRPPREAPSPARAEGLGPASAALATTVAEGDPTLLPALLDARPVAGPLDPRPFLATVREAARQGGVVERKAARGLEAPPRGFFHGVVMEPDGRSDDRLDLDVRCLGPLVSMARIAAVRGNLASTSTPTRLFDAGQRGVLPPVLAGDLAACWEFVAGLRLRFGRVATVEGAFVLEPDRLASGERRVMKDVFAVIREGLDVLASPAAAGGGRWTA